jgi:hypothetical protein
MDGGVTFASMFCSPFSSVFLLTCLPSHRETNVPLQNCFFKGSISTCCTHIAWNPNCHFPIYKSRCKEKGIIMHECAIPLNVKVFNGGQQTLDCALVPKPPQFSKSGLVDYIVELIVAKDEVLFVYFFLSCTHPHAIAGISTCRQRILSLPPAIPLAKSF